MIRTLKVILEYDGTQFRGWQSQSGNQRTVQSEVRSSLEKFLHEKITLIGSGRTDSGVHARGQVAHFKTKSQIPVEKMLRALNAHLPVDITALSLEAVHDDFHAQYSVKSKRYRYVILNRSEKPALDRNYCLHFAYPLNVPLMRREAQVLVGKKDFKSFQATDHKRSEGARGTVRCIKYLSVTKSGEYIYIDVEADGFLYKMVRNIVGTLLEIGSGKLPPGSMKDILLKCSRCSAGDTVEPQGLFLMEVHY